MKIIGCEAVVVANIQMKIDWISFGSDSDRVEVTEVLSNGRRLQIWVSKEVAIKLKEGDEIDVLAIMSPDLLLGYEVFVLAKKNGNITETIFTAGLPWTEMFSRLVF